METTPRSVEQVTDGVVEPRTNGFAVPARGPARATPGPGLARWRDRAALLLAWERVKLPVLVYLGTRAVLMAVAAIDSSLRHWAFTWELQNWDGGWYRYLASHGYLHQVLHTQTTTGFFPLYSMVVWPLSRLLLLTTAHRVFGAVVVSGVIISGVGGLIATLLVQRLAAGWWGEQAGRRAAVLFCLFPGSVVFSMVYAEGIMIPVAVGCILALQRRRWLLAGVLAAIATATEIEAAVLVVVCAASAGLELRRRGWRGRSAQRALLAPLIAPAGLIGVLAFMWAWTGTPFAYWTAQHYGWRERFDPLAIPHLAIRLARHISFAHFNHPTINLNWPVGLIGAVILVILLVLMFRIRRTISVEAWLWTLGISFIALTSEWVPPNPRLLITAFPAVIVLAYYLKRRAFAALLLVNGALLVGMSALTYVGVTLRP